LPNFIWKIFGGAPAEKTAYIAPVLVFIRTYFEIGPIYTAAYGGALWRTVAQLVS
jgi:hypothetical protein